MQVEERRRRLIRSFCAKAPVYENCRMLSHDGDPLSFIDYRKLAWYEVSSLLHAVKAFRGVASFVQALGLCNSDLTSLSGIKCRGHSNI